MLQTFAVFAVIGASASWGVPVNGVSLGLAVWEERPGVFAISVLMKNGSPDKRRVCIGDALSGHKTPSLVFRKSPEDWSIAGLGMPLPRARRLFAAGSDPPLLDTLSPVATKVFYQIRMSLPVPPGRYVVSAEFEPHKHGMVLADDPANVTSTLESGTVTIDIKG